MRYLYYTSCRSSRKENNCQRVASDLNLQKFKYGPVFDSPSIVASSMSENKRKAQAISNKGTPLETCIIVKRLYIRCRVAAKVWPEGGDEAF